MTWWRRWSPGSKSRGFTRTPSSFRRRQRLFPRAGVRQMEADGHYPAIFTGVKSDLFDGGHRVPLIVSRGGKNGGRVEQGPRFAHGLLRHVRRDDGLPAHARRRRTVTASGALTGEAGTCVPMPCTIRTPVASRCARAAGRFSLRPVPAVDSDPAQATGVYGHASRHAALRFGERSRRDAERDRRTSRCRAAPDRPDEGAYRARTFDSGPAQTNETRGEWKQTALFMNDAK